MAAQGRASERLDEHHAIARANGEKLLARPALALDAITRTQATFTRRDLAMFVHRHSEGKEQFDRIMAAVRASPELVRLGRDGRGDERFTSRDMLATEQRLARASVALEARRHQAVPDPHRKLALTRAEMRDLVLSPEQRSAFDHVTSGRGLTSVIGYAGTGKSAMLGVAREAWESAGYAVRGAALSGIAAENLESGSGITSRTIASMERQWEQGRELLTTRDVLVIDEAGMIGTRQMERVLSEAQKRGAKVVLVGDPEQLQTIEAGAAFRSIAERHGSVEITDIRRQRADWQRSATRYLATERTGEAIRAYRDHDAVHAAATRDQARADLIARWDRERQASPEASRIILTHTNDEVQALNQAARERLRSNGELGTDINLRVEKGERIFAAGDRVMFGRNERSLGVKNGTLGRIESVSAIRMAVLLDDGQRVAFDLKDYAAIDHGYAATIHKAQGVTVDNAHVLATPGLDRHAAYVALSRHRDSVQLHYGQDDFADEARLVRTLSRERGKDMATDYTSTPAPRLTREQFAGRAIPTPKPPTRLAPAPEPALEPAIERHARIVRALRFAQSISAPSTAEQRRELAASRASLDALQPHGRIDLERAFANEPRLIQEAADGRTARALRMMQLEGAMRQDPALRADVFVQRWQALERQRRLLLRDHETTRANQLGDRMIGMAKGLERDPQVESILRNRKVQLGLPDTPTRSIGQSLADMIGRGRSRGLEIGM